jgi:uroporphyrinogen III methyltransferase / synthase
MGKVFLVGAGPGDPKLITVKGLELIRRADSLIYDYLANNGLLGFAREDAELIYVGKQASRHEMSQEEINALLVRKAGEHETVVRLKGGDPYIFGRGGEEAVCLADNGVEFEVVPGITSAIAVPAYAGIPLTHRGYASTVAFVTGHEDERKETSAIRWHELATGVDTLVFLMGMKHLKEIKRRLIREGRDPATGACVIQWGTLSRQKVVTGPLRDIDSLAEEAGIRPPGIILVGDVVELRNKLAWFEKRPLHGRKVAVTRAPRQSLKLGELLSERGADVLYMPTIDIVPIEPNPVLSQALNRLDEYYCVVFTSVNGASIFFDRLFEKGRDTRWLRGVKVLPIGAATAGFLKGKGILPDFIPGDFTSEGIIEVLKGVGVKGRRFLLPRAEEARDVIVRFINEHGGVCDVVPVYRTVLPGHPVTPAEKPDIVTFTSSSTVENFVTLYGTGMLRGASVASIGPITTETLERHRIRVDITASRYDIEGLVDAIVEKAGQPRE